MKKSLWLAIISASALAVSACGTSDNTDNTGTDGGAGSDMGNVNNGDGSTSNGDGATGNGDGSTSNGDATVAVDLGPDDSTPDELTLEELPAAMANLFCSHTECFNRGEAFFFRLITGDLTGDACRARVTEVLATSDLFIPHAAVESGALTYDPSTAQDCIDELALDTTCDTLFGGGGNCGDELFQGTIASGDECTNFAAGLGDRRSACASGTSCLLPRGVPEGCAGTCEALVATGEECTSGSGDECALGPDDDYAYCSGGDFVGNRCFVSRTVHTADVGELCDVSTRDGFVDTRVMCVEGASCREVVSEAGYERRCFAVGEPSELGGPCDDVQLCQDGLVCIDRSCAMFTVVTAAEEPCGIGPSGISLCDIGGGLACELDLTKDEIPTITGTCVAVDPGAEGSSCGGAIAAVLGAACDAGLYCQTLSGEIPGLAGVCTPLLADGEECPRDNDACESGVCSYDSTDSRYECVTLVCDPG